MVSVLDSRANGLGSGPGLEQTLPFFTLTYKL